MSSQYAGLLHLLEITAVHPFDNARIAELLLRKLKLALRPSSSLASDEVHFIVSQGFHAYLRMSKAAGSVDTTLSPCFAQPSHGSQGPSVSCRHTSRMRPPRKARATRSRSKTAAVATVRNVEEDPALKSLVENLSCPSHDIRLASLELLRQIGDTQASVDCIDTMVQVEQLPLGLDQTRTIAMLLRNLGQQYASIDHSSWLGNGIPRFIFGMLNVKLSPVWDHAVEALPS